MYKTIVIITSIVALFIVGCLGKQKGIIILKNKKEIKFNSWVFYDNHKYYIRGGEIEYTISRDKIKSINISEIRR